MYKSFFGFKERPFQLVPNPAYLFLSRSHEEAMAHLTYALSQGDGFIELTGEVGTGKTTLCRAFLENLDDGTEAAYIFNPKMDSLQLLQTINQELGIPSGAENSKDLIDRLNGFLLGKKVEGKKVILVIDEAQNLSKDVLEQLRLLSNLETTTSKLLQIVLVGQPELGEMLDSPELRQLGQRITLSCNLRPLNFKETKDYIRHRIQVASQKTGVRFTWSALRVVYAYSGGIPRLVNIACDRALLTAFSLNKKVITGGIARASVRELASRGEIRRFRLQKRKRLIPFAVAACAVLLALIYWPGDYGIRMFFHNGGTQTVQSKNEQNEVKSRLPEQPAKAIPAPADQPLPSSPEKETKALSAVGKAWTNADEFGRHLTGMTSRDSRSKAIKSVLAMWSPAVEINPYLEELEDDQTYFRLVAKQSGLLLYRLEGEWGLLEKLNMPVILGLRPKGAEGLRYLALTRIEDGGLSLSGATGNTAIRVKPEDLHAYWSRISYIPWKDFLDYPGTIPFGASKESIVTLKMLLQDIGFKDIEINPYYDEKARDAVMAVQEKHGIRVDGIVGPLTKIVLYKEKVSLKAPQIKGDKTL